MAPMIVLRRSAELDLSLSWRCLCPSCTSQLHGSTLGSWFMVPAFTVGPGDVMLHIELLMETWFPPQPGLFLFLFVFVLVVDVLVKATGC